jgi:hypothetical protein
VTHFGRLCISWVGFVTIWLLFVYQVTAPELIAAGVAAALTVLAGSLVCRVMPLCFRPRMHWLAQVYRLPSMVAEDLGLLSKCLFNEILRRPSRSTFATTKFSTSPDDCRATAQRALVILFVSTTPNSIVLDVDPDENRIFYHQVGPAPVPELLHQLEI